MSRCVHSLLAVVALGCQQPNPAFESGGGSELSDESEVDASGPSETETKTETESGSATDGPLDTSDTNEGSTTETGEPEMCELELRPALRLAVRTANEPCPADLEALPLLLDPATVNAELGVAMGSKCEDFTCGSCPSEGYAVGSPGFEDLGQTWTLLAGLAMDENLAGLCVEVTAGSYVGMVDGACIYAAIGIRDNTIEHGPIFVGQVGDAPLTPIAMGILDEAPALGTEPIETCSCASVLSADIAELQCCEASALEPSFYTLELLGVQLGPGESGPLPNLQVPWKYSVVQAQVVPTCEDPLGETMLSWALTRVN
jgi:hypothetical protein